MFMERLRAQMKWIIIAVAVAFAVTLMYVGVPLFFRDQVPAEAAIARVNGDTIGNLAFQRAFLEQLRAYEQTQGAVRPTDIEQIKYQALNDLINARLILQAARDEGVRVSRREIDQRMDQIRDSFPSRASYERELQVRNMTEADLRRAVEEGLMAEKLQEKLASGFEVTDEELKRAYEQVRVRQILIRPESENTQAWEAARAQAERVYQRLKRGADFAQVAKEESDDETSAPSGGDLGMIGHGELPDAVDKVAFSLAVGALSEPVKSEQGYHILQVTEKKEAAGEAFEAAKEDLARQMRLEKADQHFAQWFADLRRAADVSILDPQLAARDALVRGDAEKALSLYRQALEKAPDDAYVHYGVGVTLMQMKKADEALASFKRAAELAPSDPVLHLALGSAYQQKGDKDQAAAALRKASELSPMDMQMHLTLYMLYSSMGLKQDASREEQEIQKIQQVLEQQRQAQEEFLKRLQEQQSQQPQESAPAPSPSESPSAVK